jgi:hypothetical protein
MEPRNLMDSSFTTTARSVFPFQQTPCIVASYEIIVWYKNAFLDASYGQMANFELLHKTSIDKSTTLNVLL